MKLLWSKDLKLNTVHVDDVSRACWHLTQWYTDNNISATGQVPIFNLVDKQDTDQEAINKQLQTIFEIKTGYHGSVVSTFAKVKKITCVYQPIFHMSKTLTCLFS